MDSRAIYTGTGGRIHGRKKGQIRDYPGSPAPPGWPDWTDGKSQFLVHPIR
jgi:hypothetical protein